LAAALTGPLAAYRCPNKKADGCAVYTNLLPGGGFRGYGSSQTTFAVECAIDDLAKKLGVDPFEIRRRNMIRPDDWIGSIWGDPSDVDFGSYGLDQCMDRVECASEVVAQGGEQQTALSERNPLRENKRMLLLWLTRLVVQGHFRDTGRDIEARRALDTHWLQGNRIPRTADQHIGAESDRDCRAPCRAGICPGQRARCRISGRCDHRPNNHPALQIADIDTEFIDGPDIVLWRASRRRKGAVDRPRGAEDEAKAAGYIAGEHPDLQTLCLHRGIQRQSAGSEAEGTNCYSKFPEHFFQSPASATASHERRLPKIVPLWGCPAERR
jgi:hypothetical protein